MKRAWPLLLAWTLLGAVTPGSNGDLRSYSMSAPSLHDRDRTVRVYLPPDYTDPTHATTRYPTVYLLHGWPGSDGNWVKSGKAGETLDRLIAAHRIPELIAVFPDGRGSGLLGRSVWMDSYDGDHAVERFVTQDLVSWVDSSFRTIRDPARRAVIGLSDGGTGAFNLAMRHPEVFSAAGSHSGMFLLSRDLGMGGVVGPDPGGARLLAEHSPRLYAPGMSDELKHLELYFDCGTDDESIDDNRAFHKLLDSLGVAHTYREYPGTHDWDYWRTHLEESLETLTARWR
ncbi:MAG: alpha/beta hydrolase [Candidatus Eisenbacteria bacterium]